MTALYQNTKRNERGGTTYELTVVLVSAFSVFITVAAVVSEVSISFWSLSVR
jgi:hypothetical protein